MIGGIIGVVTTYFTGLWQVVDIGIQMVTAALSGNWDQAFSLAQKGVETWAQTIIQMFLKVVGGAAGMVDSLTKLFGVDLGMKAKVQGISTSIGGPGATVAAPPPPLPAASSPSAGAAAPAVAAAQGQAANTAALTGALAQAPAAKAPDVNVKTTLVVDGQVLADTVQKHSAQSANRAFAPAPATP
jgi:cobalamin biosynthesis Mg chelatase CobN